MSAVVIIPVHREVLNDFELISINQNLKMLGSHPIVFVAPYSLNISVFSHLLDKFNINSKFERFDDLFFEEIESYNRLLLSVEFYLRFSKYDYMLICQPDAYIFRDELDYWCSCGYDFIGAPLIGLFNDTKFTTNMRVGNGGLSLRKISTFINAFTFSGNLLSSKEIIKRNAVFRKLWTRIPLLILMKFGYKNKFRYFAKNWKYNEDDFWSGFLDNTHYPLTKPEPFIALEFAFERFPSNCFEITNKIPFGCHAWEKYECDDFWRKYI